MFKISFAKLNLNYLSIYTKSNLKLGKQKNKDTKGAEEKGKNSLQLLWCSTCIKKLQTNEGKKKTPNISILNKNSRKPTNDSDIIIVKYPK